MMIPFGVFAPDQSRYTPGTSPNIVNALPIGQTGWGPLPQLVTVSSALPAEPRGAIAVRDSTGAYSMYALVDVKAYIE